MLDKILGEQLDSFRDLLGSERYDAVDQADCNAQERRGGDYVRLAEKFLELFSLGDITDEIRQAILDTARDLGKAYGQADAYLHLIDRHGPIVDDPEIKAE